MIHFHKTSGGKDIINEFIDNQLSLQCKAQVKVILLSLEKDMECTLEVLNTKFIKRPLFEIKINNIRLFCTRKDKDLYILHITKKQKNKTEKLDKELALKRLSLIM